jgi:hypothetical protein
MSPLGREFYCADARSPERAALQGADESGASPLPLFPERDASQAVSGNKERQVFVRSDYEHVGLRLVTFVLSGDHFTDAALGELPRRGNLQAIPGGGTYDGQADVAVSSPNHDRVTEDL